MKKRTIYRKIQIYNQIESKYGVKMKNHYSHKIIATIKQNESKYGNKFGSVVKIKYGVKNIPEVKQIESKYGAKMEAE